MLQIYQKINFKRFVSHIIPGIYMLADYIGIVLAEKTALFLQQLFRLADSEAMILPWEYQYVIVPCMLLLFIFVGDGYKFNRPTLEVNRDLLKGSFFAFLIYMLCIFFMDNSMHISRYYAGCFFVFMLLYIFIARSICGAIIHRMDMLKEPALLLGAGKTAERLLECMSRDGSYHYKVIGILDDNPVSKKLPKQYPILGDFDAVVTMIKDMKIKTIILAAPGLSEQHMKKLLYSISPLTDTILFTPSLVGVPLGSVEISTLFVEQLTVIKSKNNLSRWYNRALKFVFDMVLTTIGTVLISPIFLALCVLVAIDNKGKVFFAHQRIGKGGKLFPCYKFQTMLPNAESVLKSYLSENPQARKEWETNYKLSNDPRVTKLGKILRKTSLDELPQIFNVLKGEMSLVGPRPVVVEELEKYGENKKEYLMVRPGITGMWQASGRSDTTYEERVAMDTWYVHNWSLWIDFKYLCRTFTTVIKREGAY